MTGVFSDFLSIIPPVNFAAAVNVAPPPVVTVPNVDAAGYWPHWQLLQRAWHDSPAGTSLNSVAARLGLQYLVAPLQSVIPGPE